MARELLAILTQKVVHMKNSARWLLIFLFALLVALADTAHAQRDAFPVLPGMEKQVEFWKRVFTEYGFSQLIYFDPQDMGTIYEVSEVGPDNLPDETIRAERARIAAANGVSIDRVYAQRGVKEKTAEGLKRSGRYIAQMQQILRERGVPIEISYLPMVESSFDINVRSYMGALGMWQFMPATGRSFNMRVESAIDERRDPIESTRAAASYLKQAYESLGSWPLAITSYNYGPAGMARAVADMGTNNLVELIRSYNGPYWGFAPKNFYAEFLVAVEIGKNIQRYFPGLVLEAPVTTKDHELTGMTSLEAVANASGLSQDQLLAWNPALTSAVRWLPAGYRVKLPVEVNMEPIVEVVRYEPPAAPVMARGRGRVVAAANRATQPKAVHHQVRPGETLGKIAARYGASVQRILQVNGLRHANLVKIGSTLVIPRA